MGKPGWPAAVFISVYLCSSVDSSSLSSEALGRLGKPGWPAAVFMVVFSGYNHWGRSQGTKRVCNAPHECMICVPMVMRNEYLLCRPAYGHKAPPCMYPGLNCKHCTKEVQSRLVYSYNTRACAGAEIKEVAIDWSCIPKHKVGTVARQFSNK